MPLLAVMPVYPRTSVFPVVHLHSVEPSVESEFTLHGAHDEFGQFLYFPDSHGPHGPPSGPEKLGMHWQRSIEALPIEDIVRSGHVLHGAAPVKFLYVPPAHATQAVPSGPVYPVLQTHWLSSAMPIAAVSVFTGHVAHACEPSQSLYLP